MSPKLRTFTITMCIGITLTILAVLLFYIDDNDSKIYAFAALAIIPNLLTFYFSNTSNNGDISRVVDVNSFKKRRHKHVVPTELLFAILIAIVLWLHNLLLDGFRAGIEQLGLPDAKYVDIQVFYAGAMLFGSILPISALIAIKIGFRPQKIYFRSPFISSSITIGSMVFLTIIHAVLTGQSPINAILGTLFLGNTEPILPSRAEWLLVTLTMGAGIVVIGIISTWLWAWAKFGQWQFYRQYSVAENN